MRLDGLRLPDRANCGIFGIRKVIEPKAAITSFLLGGYNSPPDERKEGDAVITYQDLFLFCTFIVALISLLYQIFKGRK